MEVQTESHPDEHPDEDPDDNDPPQHLQNYIDAFQDDFDGANKVINACIISTATEEDWFVDSGASSHVTCDPSLVSNLSPCSIPHIRTDGVQAMPIAGQGTVHLTNSLGAIKTIHNVLYIPGVKTNLLSVGKLTDARYRVTFDTQHCLIFDRHQSHIVFLQGIRDTRNNLYHITTMLDCLTPSRLNSS